MFEELKIRRLLKKNLTKEKYMKLPYAIQEDLRIIEHLIKGDPSAISVIDSSVDITPYVLEDYSLIQYLNSHQLNSIILTLDITNVNMTKELFDKLYDKEKDAVFKKMPGVCFDYFDIQKKVEIIKLIAEAKYHNNELSKFYNLFSDEDFKKIILGLPKEKILGLFYSQSPVKKYVMDFIEKLDDKEFVDIISNVEAKAFFRLLVYEEDVKEFLMKSISDLDDDKLSAILPILTDVYEELSPSVKNRVDLINANDNLDKIIKLSDEAQVMYFTKNVHLVGYARKRDIIRRCLIECGCLSVDMLIKHYMSFDPSVINALSSEERLKLFSQNFRCVYEAVEGYQARLQLKDIMFDKINKILDVEKKNQLWQLFLSLDDKLIVSGDSYIYHRQHYQISRLIYDDNIVNNNSVDLLVEYKNTYSRDLLIKILANAYGEHVIEIFKERPYLNLLHIDNFKLFDKKIYDKLGKNFIHHILNCELGNLDAFIGEIADNEEVLNKFAAYFECLTRDLNKLDINTITNIMQKFVEHRDIIMELDFDNLSDERKRNLQLLVNDYTGLTISVQSIEDFDNYIEIRRNRYLEMGRELTYLDDLKNLIFAYVFGRSVDDESFLEKLSLGNAIKVFNIDNIINNEEIIEKMRLTKDEVAMLLLIHEVNSNYSVNVLKDVFESLVHRDLNISLFSSTFDKIKNYYIEDVKKGLLSSSMLESMPKQTIDGVDVVPFEGDNFTLICSVTSLNLSSRGRVIGLAKSGKRLLNDWLNRENGVNVIATAIASSDTDIYPLPKKIWDQISGNVVFVFDSDVDIIAFGASDISSEHNIRSRSHTFGFVGCDDKKTGFSTMEELKTRINENKISQPPIAKFDSEVTITRREEDIREEKGGLKRTMPMAMYVVGELLPEHLETAKAFNDYYQEKGLGKFRIIQVNPQVYKGRGRVDNSVTVRGVETYGKNI